MKTTSTATLPFSKIFQSLTSSAIFGAVLVVATAALAQPKAVLRGPWFFDRPLEPVMETTEGLQDAALLKRGFDAVAQLSAQEGEDLIEQFIVEHPSSVWAPSLRANLGRHYVEQGAYTRALQHWEAAWEATKGYTDGAGKRVADSRSRAAWCPPNCRLARCWITPRGTSTVSIGTKSRAWACPLTARC